MSIFGRGRGNGGDSKNSGPELWCECHSDRHSVACQACCDEWEKNSKEGAPASDFGINGTTGDLVSMEELGIWEPFSVKVQTIKTAIESACMILRIDDIVSGSKKSQR